LKYEKTGKNVEKHKKYQTQEKASKTCTKMNENITTT